MTQIRPKNGFRVKLLERDWKSPTRLFWTQCVLGLTLIVCAISVQSSERPVAELLCILGLVLVIFGPTKLPGLGRSIKAAFDEFNNGSGGGFAPPGVPVESSLRVQVQPKRKHIEPPLPPL